jgi:branched-chain amino acid transport system substrate-binding protein
MIKRALAALIGVALMMAVTPINAADNVKVGYSYPQTGFLSPFASVQLQAQELWKDQINAAGGLSIGGSEKRKIEFVSYDDRSEVPITPTIYEKLISDDKVDLLLGPYGTPWHMSIVPVLERHRFPLIASTASSVTVREANAKYMFFAEKLPDENGPGLASFLKLAGATKLALFTLQFPNTLEVKKFALPEIEKAGIEIVVNQEYGFEIKDFTASIARAQAEGADAVVALSFPGDGLKFIQRAREMNLTAPIQYVYLGPGIPSFMDTLGANLNGIVSLAHWSQHNKNWPRAKPFYDAYRARYNEPPDLLDSVIAYMAAEILQQAVEAVGLDREKMREHLASATFETINGPVRFEQQTNVLTPPGVFQFQDGEPQIIWPPEIATGKFMPKPAWQ